ncbi:hypothetical protein [Streptomyces alkaliterrae]|uniref:Uncharacterized protein n=1 Tax=Streptomyces alkaliterrae TaxID=2213162 RepID=A0A5P0YUH6_9ACTN|nr:hypothetical protein [Streptomyces alkaliterrae]MBB1255467.1 hypothetical protein [Streptomyces alkaliterrae]MBB1260722.1 hypothetical protein [Streptomyces alkaliterrae]MQS03963.1 hypothetical protein [Streptomyces alkaliterrae]
MQSEIFSSDDVQRSPISRNLARELAAGSIDSPDELYETAVDLATSLTNGHWRDDKYPPDERLDRAAAEQLVAAMKCGPALLTSRSLVFPQAIIGLEGGEPLRQPKLFYDRFLCGKPAGVLWTSSLLAPGLPAWAMVAESGYVAGQDPVEGVEFFADADEFSVFTINSPCDFAELCEEFGSVMMGSNRVLDWRRVSEVHHAVHLTFSGLILAQGVPVQTSTGTMTLNGWDSESTVWLRIPESARLGRRFLVE